MKGEIDLQSTTDLLIVNFDEVNCEAEGQGLEP